jgi:hypothetical protein
MMSPLTPAMRSRPWATRPKACYILPTTHLDAALYASEDDEHGSRVAI